MEKLLILLGSVAAPVIFILAFIGLGITLAVIIDEWFETLFK